MVQRGASPTGEYTLFQLMSNSRSQPLEVSVKVDGHPLNMEIDTGAAVTLISESTYHHLGLRPLQPTTARLCTYSGEALGVLGKLEVEVQLGQQQEKLPLLVIKGE